MKSNFFKSLKVEGILFFLLAALNTVPIFAAKYFPTLDGPAHLYSSNLLVEIITGNDFIRSFFIVNNFPVPNWLGHFIITVFHFFLPAYIAEKAFLLIYLFGLTYSFRWVIQMLNPGNSWLSFLIFIFSYNNLLFLGFYNLEISFVLFFLSIGYWLKNETAIKIGNWIVLTLLATLTYLAHVFTYLCLGLTLSCVLLFRQASGIGLLGFSSFFKNLIKSLFLLFSVFVPSVVLMVLYFAKTPIGNSGSSLSYTVPQLFQRLAEASSIICLSDVHEQPYTSIVVLLLVLLFALSAIFSIKRVHTPGDDLSNRTRNASYAFLFISLVILFLFFAVPNDFNAGMESDRFEIMFFLILITCIAVGRTPGVLVLILIVPLLIIHFILVRYYFHGVQFENGDAMEYEQISKDIKPNSIVLPISYTTNWLEGHSVDYLGIDKPMIILGNYENGLRWFPVIWKRGTMPSFYLGGVPVNTLVSGLSDVSVPCDKPIDYVVLWQKQNCKDSSISKIQPLLDRDYLLLKRYRDAELYELKSTTGSQ